MPPDALSQDRLVCKPVTLNEWDDLQTLFAETGPQKGCWCMYWRVKRADFNKEYGVGLKESMKGILESDRVPGILGYLDGKPVGWCSVAPREEFPVLDRSPVLKRMDNEPVWSIVCFFVAKQNRRQGLTRRLIEGAIEYAKGQGARIIEAYPVIPRDNEAPVNMYTGVESTFAQLGFKEAVRRSERRPIMRYFVTDEP